MELKCTQGNRNCPSEGMNSPPCPGVGQEPPPDIPVQAGEEGGLLGRGLQSSSGDVIPQRCCFERQHVSAELSTEFRQFLQELKS